MSQKISYHCHIPYVRHLEDPSDVAQWHLPRFEIFIWIRFCNLSILSIETTKDAADNGPHSSIITCQTISRTFDSLKFPFNWVKYIRSTSSWQQTDKFHLLSPSSPRLKFFLIHTLPTIFSGKRNESVPPIKREFQQISETNRNDFKLSVLAVNVEFLPKANHELLGVLKIDNIVLVSGLDMVMPFFGWRLFSLRRYLKLIEKHRVHARIVVTVRSMSC